MAISRSVKSIVAGAFLLIPAAAMAAPGGGSGGGGAPSSSARSYDPVEEYRKGVEALQAQRYAEAGKAFDRVLAVAPTDANTNFMAGLAATGLEDFKAARRYYERAIKADKELVVAHRELGLTYIRLGERSKAEAELGKLKAMQQACAAGCAKSAEIGTAIETVSAALTTAPSASLQSAPGLIFASAAAGDGAYLEAVGLINERRYQEAIDALHESQRAFGPHPDILTYLGFVNRKLGRLAVAEGYYRAALAAAPDHRGATEYFGELMVERGDIAGARTMLASLERSCAFGCAEADELRRWIEAGPGATR